MVINTNIAAMITSGALYKASLQESQSIEKLSTGQRINSAADDAAGLGISEKLTTQVNGLNQAAQNTQDAISMLNIADGALNEDAAILQRMRELVIQAKNDTYTSVERGYMGTEFNQLIDQLDQINASTNYNGLQIFADPNAANYVTNGVYSNDAVNGIQNAQYQTAHSATLASDIYTDPSKSIFGASDSTSANYYNFNIGGNYSAQDAAAVSTAADRDAYADRGAVNMVTVEFGQMDANSLLTPTPEGISVPAGVLNNNPLAMGDAKALWNSLNFNGDPDPGFNFANNTTDNEDTELDFMGPKNWSQTGGGPVVDMNTQDKLDLLLNIIDGKTSNINSDLINNAYGGVVETTGLARVNTMRAAIGAWTNVLQHSLNNTMNAAVNQQAAESTIRDTDFAAETTQFTQSQILTQSATAMLAQANQMPKAVLSLLQ